MEASVVVSRECRAALDLSLRIKKEEAKLRSLRFWGRVVAANGQDYLLARGSPLPPSVSNNTLTHLSKLYYSQDGVRWMDLQDISEEIYNACNDIRACFTGEPSHIYSNSKSGGDENMKDEENEQSVDDTPENEEMNESNGDVEQDDLDIEQDDGETQNDGIDDQKKMPTSKSSGNKTLKIGELERLSALMKRVDHDCGVIPKGALVLDANKNLVENLHFPGVKFLQDLDSYVHLFQSYEGTPLSNDVHGSWSIEVLPFQGVVLRSLWWLGYTFYYDIASKKFESIYFGLGLKNIDLPFMI